MKNCVKKLAITGVLTVITMFTITVASNAATVKVTGDTLNIRKKPSTDSDVIAMLFKGVECELLEEAGDWYKIKYQNYTGYISKQYSKVLEEKTKGNTATKTTDKTESTTKAENTDKAENTNKTEKTENTSKTETTDKNQASEETQEITYKKLNKKVNAKILPLIYGNEIGQLKKGEEVILLSEITGWSYVQATNISGWVRTENLDNVKKQQVSSNKEEKTGSKDNENNTQKTAYVNESYVNVRNGAGTSYKVIKTLTLNSKVTITGEENGWYKVKSGSDEGYILKELLSDSQKTTSRANQTNRTENKNIEETKTTKNVETVKKEESTPKQETAKKEESTPKQETTTKQETTSKNTIKDTDVIAYAKKFLGHKYVYGGNGSDGTFDCSGFTMYVYKHFGINLPHGATSQYNSGKGTKIKKESELKAGDIVLLTDYETGVGIGHCGIYIGDGKFIHASTTTYSVIISSLKTTYAGRFYAGLRLI